MLCVVLHFAAVVEENFVERQLQATKGSLAAIRSQLTFPHRDAMPPHAGQLVLHGLVPFLVAVHLLEPEVAVGLRKHIVFASLMLVPETTVHEDAGSVPTQHNIWLPRQPRMIEAVAESVAPKVFPHHPFRLRILTMDGRHCATSFLGTYLVCHTI